MYSLWLTLRFRLKVNGLSRCQQIQYDIFLVNFVQNGRRSSLPAKLLNYLFSEIELFSLLRGRQKKRKQAANIIRMRLNLWQRGDFVSLQRIEFDGTRYSLEDIEAYGTVKFHRYVDKMVTNSIWRSQMRAKKGSGEV